MKRVVSFLGLIGAVVLIAIPVETNGQKPSSAEDVSSPAPGGPRSFLRYYIERVDRIDLVLLDRFEIGNYPDWRERFYGQMFGFGVRTRPQPLSDEDVEAIKMLLLDPGSWVTGTKSCELACDAGLQMSGPDGEVSVALELWCARAHLRTTGYESSRADGNVDPIQEELLTIVKKYYPEDAYLTGLVEAK